MSHNVQRYDQHVYLRAAEAQVRLKDAAFLEPAAAGEVLACYVQLLAPSGEAAAWQEAQLRVCCVAPLPCSLHAVPLLPVCSAAAFAV